MLLPVAGLGPPVLNMPISKHSSARSRLLEGIRKFEKVCVFEEFLTTSR